MFMRTIRGLSVLLVLLLVVSGCSLISGASQPKHDPMEYFPQDVELARIVAQGDAEEVAQALSGGADPNTQGPGEHNLLQWAMLNGNVDAVSALLEAGADPDMPAAGGHRALHMAVGVNVSDSVGDQVIPLLLDAGADIDATNPVTGSTALSDAAVTGSDASFIMLLDADADPNIANLNSSYPLHSAARVNRGALIVMLLEAGADPLVETSNGTSFQDFYFGYNKALLNERALGEREAVANWLQDHGYEVSSEA